VSKAAAVLALNSLRIHSATVNTHEGVAATEFVVSPLFGAPPETGLLRQQFTGALNGDVDVVGALEKRDSDAVAAATARAGEIQLGVPVTRSTAPPRILWLDTGTPGQLVLEVRAMDRAGLLALLARALERADADIQWAKVNTFGSTAADVFCVTVAPEDEQGARAAVEQHLLAVLGGPAVEVLDEPGGDRERGVAGRSGSPPSGLAAGYRSALSCRTASMRSLSCSRVAAALGGPPQRRRSSLWIQPWGLPVRWWAIETSALSSRRSSRSWPCTVGGGSGAP
jgi:hypothetical protein